MFKNTNFMYFFVSVVVFFKRAIFNMCILPSVVKKYALALFDFLSDFVAVYNELLKSVFISALNCANVRKIYRHLRILIAFRFC